ncbi:MAG: dihydrodipicolinate synthase family protein [Boseongicola sp.]
MKGIVPSLNTPFDADNAIDHCSLRRLVNHTVEAGCGGMLALAVAGEYPTLTQDEKTAVIETVAETNALRIPLIVSVTAADQEASVALTKAARSAGAAGICVQLPVSRDRQEKLGFLQELECHAPSILMVQDLDWSGGGLSLDEIQYLYENVKGFSWLKIETAQPGPKYSAVMRANNGALNVCGGWAVTQLMDAMARGVNAFIPTGLESVYVAIYRMYESGEHSAARALFERVLPILNFSNQHIDTSILFFKQLRKAEGIFDTANCRTANAKFDEVQQIEAGFALSSALELIRLHQSGSQYA